MFDEKNLEKLDLRKGDQKRKKSISFLKKVNEYSLRFTPISLKEKLFFVQYLVPMLKVGISLSRALKTLSKQSQNKRFKAILIEVGNKVEAGSSFTEAIRPHSDIFGELFVNMIEAGELSGNLENVLEQLYIQIKKDHDLISKVKTALTYPIVIMVAMFGIGTFMFIVVIPKMTSIFKEMNVELPLLTKILISVSNAIANNVVLALLIFIVSILLFIKIIKTKKGKYIFQGIVLKIPIIAPIIKKINLARFARNLGSLLKTDIMIVKSFKITSKVLGNIRYREAILEMGNNLKKGKKLGESIQIYPKLFPPVVSQMISVGEETGELDTILGELAEFYENEVDQIMKELPSLIEPLLILVLGVGVGGVAAAVIMPMYSLSSSM